MGFFNEMILPMNAFTIKSNLNLRKILKQNCLTTFR